MPSIAAAACAPHEAGSPFPSLAVASPRLDDDDDDDDGIKVDWDHVIVGP
jgi:hypothetical protein